MINNAFHLKGRYNRTGFKKVWVVADFAQLHKNVDDTQKISHCQGFLRPEQSEVVSSLLLPRTEIKLT